MIVKNETRVIRRCLDTVRPFIDYWVIVDTGSDDGTQDTVREILSDIPGELHERPWKDFGTNRSEALELARDKADYTLIIDADEVLVTEPGFTMPELTLDEYATEHAAGDSGTTFFLPQIVKSSLPWRYEGVLHEHIACDEPHSRGRIPGILCRGFFDGARNVDPKLKYQNDARVLEKALEDDPDNSRYVFYLAQSYRDAGNLERAIEAYARRAAMGGWAEEVWYSLYQRGVLLARQGGPFAPALEAYLAAYQYRPSRAEPLCDLARHYRVSKQFALAYLFASRAAAIARPNDSLFLDVNVYTWRSLDELSIAAYYVGQPKEALALGERLLREGRLPDSERGRVEQNLEFSRQALAGQDKKAKNARRATRGKERKKRRR